MPALHPSLTDPIRLPGPLALPLRLLPNSVHSRIMAHLLNRVLKEPLQEGELEILQGRTLRVEVKDAGLQYGLTLVNGQLQASANPPDVTMSGHVHDFLLMLTRREDPDTLFFQRRLSIQGDTELGLTIKNFLDSLDWEHLPLSDFGKKGLDKTLDLYQRLLSRSR